MLRADELPRLVDVELHPVKLAQQVVREFDVGLVDLVDQQHARTIGVERLPHHALDDVVRNVLHAAPIHTSELRVAQSGHGVVFVQSLLCLGRRLDVPLQERHVERLGDFLGQHRLAGAGLALDQQRALQRDRCIDGELEVAGRDVIFRSFEPHIVLVAESCCAVYWASASTIRSCRSGCDGLHPARRQSAAFVHAHTHGTGRNHPTHRRRRAPASPSRSPCTPCSARRP